MKKLETVPLHLKIMMKKLPLDLMFNSDKIGLHWKWMSSGPVPWGKQHELRGAEGRRWSVTQAPGADAICGLPVSVFLFGSLQFICIACVPSSIGVEWLAPNPIFLNSSCIFSVVNYFGFWFKSTPCGAEAKTPVLPTAIFSATLDSVFLLQKAFSRIRHNVRNFFLPYVIRKILNAKSS